MLDADRVYAPFTIIGLETPARFEVAPGISAGGDIDRVDRKDGVTRIVDYKTGTISDSLASVSDLFIDDRKKDTDGWLQTLLYCEGWLSKKPGEVVRPSVYKAKRSSVDANSDKLRIKPSKSEELIVEDYSMIRDEFLAGFKSLVNDILSPDEPFIMTSDSWGKCGYCPYKRLCLK